MVPEAMLEYCTHCGGHIAQVTRACLKLMRREFCEVLGLIEEPPEV